MVHTVTVLQESELSESATIILLFNIAIVMNKSAMSSLLEIENDHESKPGQIILSVIPGQEHTYFFYFPKKSLPLCLSQA